MADKEVNCEGNLDGEDEAKIERSALFRAGKKRFI
jgi:hypothetical protein